MRRFFQNKAVVIALILIAVVLLASAALSIFAKGTSLPYRIANAIVSPFQKGFTAAKNGVASFWDAHTKYDALLKENEALKDELRAVKELIGDAARYRSENETLRALLDIRKQYANLTIDTASVIAWNDTAWSSVFTINKGTRDGVQKGCCVMTKDGVAGVVTQAESTTAEVRSVVDSRFSAGAWIPSTGLFAQASGDFRLMKNGRLCLELIPLNSAIKAGDRVVTSGVGGVFPPELVIGEVSAVQTAPDGMTLYAEVTPSALLEQMQQVFVVLAFE